MKFFLSLLIALVGLGFSGSAYASVSDGTVISEASLASLSAWVEEATHVKMSFLPVAVASDRKLQRILHVEDAQHAGAMGAYLPGRLVVSSSMWDPDSVVAQSYVLHELVHHAQFISGKAYACHAAKEREAYTLQSKWLVQHGLKPLVTQAWIDKMSACPAPGAKTEAD